MVLVSPFCNSQSHKDVGVIEGKMSSLVVVRLWELVNLVQKLSLHPSIIVIEFQFRSILDFKRLTSRETRCIAANISSSSLALSSLFLSTLWLNLTA